MERTSGTARPVCDGRLKGSQHDRGEHSSGDVVRGQSRRGLVKKAEDSGFGEGWSEGDWGRQGWAGGGKGIAGMGMGVAMRRNRRTSRELYVEI